MTRCSRGFDITADIRSLCADFITRLSELSHVDLRRVAIGYAQVRSVSLYGLQATLTPMRFAAGAERTVSGRRQYGVQKLVDSSGAEYLYILTVYLPRLANQSKREKVHTLMHELWHIAPSFNGDLRRFSGRCYAHGSSQRQFDAHCEQLADKWWALNPPIERFDFLQHDFDSLVHKYGQVRGTRIPNPKLIPIPAGDRQ